MRTTKQFLIGIIPVLSFFVGATHADPIQRSSEDASTTYLGAIADLDWGRPISSGDLDGDGFDEILVSASESFGDVISRVYVMRGGPDARFRGTVDLSQSGVDQEILGAELNDNLGGSIATGDVNGDGIDDLLLCASTANFASRNQAGVAYLIYGGPTFFASTTRDLAVASNWDVKIAGPVAGGHMGGAGLFGDFDTHAADIGNLNGDAFGDIVLGVHHADGSAGQTQAGRVYVVMGEAFTTGLTLNLISTADFNARIFGESEYDELGDFVLTADVTGDGIDELIIPNQFASQTLFSTEGAVHVFRGRATWPLNFDLRTQTAEITLLGDFSYDKLGETAVAGDFNGDGIMDLASGAPGGELDGATTSYGDGFVYGLLGSNGFQTGTHLIDYASAAPDFLLVGGYRENLAATITAGDYNGDGLDDVAAGERFAGPNINGIVTVLFGRDFTGSPTYIAEFDADVRIMGSPSDRIGFSLWTADVDSNGADEILYGTPFNNGSFPDTYGTVYAHSLLDGDHDGDGALDLVDFSVLQACFTQPTPVAKNAACYMYDIVNDGVLDLADVEAFIDHVTGPS